MSDLVTLDRQAFTQALARFNRRITNPFLLSFAGRPHSPFTIVRHIGRKSGLPYATPVIATPTAEGFVIPLTYGDTTDWLRNLQAAGEGIIAHQGHAYHVARPRVVVAQDWARVVGPLTARMLTCADVRAYVRVARVSAAPMDRAVYDEIISDHPMARGLKVLGGGVALLAAIVVQEGGFETLAAPRSRGAVLEVTFAPEATESAMREVLQGVSGRVVDGPSAIGVWSVRLSVPDDDHAGVEAAVDRLSARADVVSHVRAN